MLLFDVEPKVEPVREEEPWNPPTPPLEGRPGGSGVFAGWRSRWLGWRAGWGASASSGAREERAADGLAGLWEVTWALTKPAPKVPFNVEIGPDRSFCWAHCSLDDFKRIKNALGGTVNDVSLAVAAGALRRWLQDRGVDTDGLELQALVPVSVRAENEHGELGNRLTAMRGPLPVGIADPVERLRFVTAAMDGLKASKQPLGAEAIWGLNDWFRDFAPPLLLAPTAAINFSTRLFNLLVTNFPGPQVPFYVLGRELTGSTRSASSPSATRWRSRSSATTGAINFGLLADRSRSPTSSRSPATSTRRWRSCSPPPGRAEKRQLVRRESISR